MLDHADSKSNACRFWSVILHPKFTPSARCHAPPPACQQSRLDCTWKLRPWTLRLVITAVVRKDCRRQSGHPSSSTHRSTQSQKRKRKKAAHSSLMLSQCHSHLPESNVQSWNTFYWHWSEHLPAAFQLSLLVLILLSRLIQMFVLSTKNLLRQW